MDTDRITQCSLTKAKRTRRHHAQQLAVRGGPPAGRTGTHFKDSGRFREQSNSFRRLSPAVIWAGIGIAAFLAQAVVIGRWIGNGDIHPTSRDYTISTTRATIIWAEQAAMLIGLIVVFALLTRHCLRERRVTFSAAFFWGNFASWWLSPIMAYRELSPVSNRYAINVVSWGSYLPGWGPPHPETHIETLLAAQMLMFPLIIAWIWIQMWMINVIADRLGRPSAIRMLPLFLLTGLLSDFVVEGLLVSVTGAYGYPLGLRHLSLFGGHWYQLPLANMTLAAIVLCTVPSLMIYTAARHNREIHIFRGTETLRPGPQTWLRILAGIGYANAYMLVYVALVACVPLLGTDPPPDDTPAWLWGVR